ncbi:unnamed protein product [Pedinophyceae sp. YPF-701]|nr:unnamed protein product [Pedinophyceae sp. YPF-701]
MRPYLLKGHERPLTYVKYNHDGDLLFSMAKDKKPTVWWADDGQRLGTFVGVNGATYMCDVTRDSRVLITASGDSTVRLWSVYDGQELFKFAFNEPCRACSFATGDRLAVSTTDMFLGSAPAIHVLKIAEDPLDQGQHSTPVRSILMDDAGRITRAFFTPLNDQIVTSHEDGTLRRFDVETGKCLQEEKVHEKIINDLSLSQDKTHAVTASSDRTSHLVDVDTFQIMKTYKPERPVLTATMSPKFDHIALGGGQDAASVTMTAAAAGKFEAMFYHKHYTEEFGRVRGHFGPLNALAFAPDGKGFATGGEDGYVRLHHFDSNYLDVRFF